MFTNIYHLIAFFLYLCSNLKKGGAEKQKLQGAVSELFSAMGIKPVLVNAREIKGVKGRPKADKLDCMWICRLHSYGLLRGSFVPPVHVAALKNLCDCREKIKNESSRTIQRMQKVLQMMNCRLDNAVSNIVGESGQLIILAILDGERDPAKLVEMVHVHVEKILRE